MKPLEFRRRRALNWLLCGSMYAFFYMARYNFAAAGALLADRFGWTNARLGVISSTATFVYGLSVLFNGPLADRIGGRRAILAGAAGAALFNLLFGLMHIALLHPAAWAGEGAARHVVVAAQIRMGMSGSTALAALAVLWACNHYFQSFGALSIVKINAAWFHLRERGLFSGLFGILIRAGLILAFYGSPLILSVLPWQWVFFVPALCLGVLFVANFALLRNTPHDAGLPAYDTGEESTEEPAGPAGLGLVLGKVVANPTMWILTFASVMIGFVRRSVIDDWFPKYFANVFGVDPAGLAKFPPYVVAGWGIAAAGITGGIIFGLLSDRIFGGRRAPVVAIGFCGQALVLGAFGLFARSGGGAMGAALSLVALSFFVNGAHGMVGGAASMDFGGRKAAATAAGLLDGAQYLVAGPLVGVGLGRLLDAFGWGVWPFAPIPFAVAGALAMVTIWNVLPASHRAQEKQPDASRSTAVN